MLKRRLIVIISCIVAAAVLVAGGLAFWLSQRSFRLDPQYYGQSNITEINIDEVKSLIDQRASFVLFAYQSSCSTSDAFKTVLEAFAQQYSVSLLATSFTALRQAQLVDGLKYYPSAIIYHDGQVVNFLDANSDADLPAYESVDGFAQWLTENRVQLTQ